MSWVGLVLRNAGYGRFGGGVPMRLPHWKVGAACTRVPSHTGDWLRDKTSYENVLGSITVPFDTMFVRKIDAATADLIQIKKAQNVEGPTGQPMRIRGRWTANPRLIMATDDSIGSSVDRLEFTGNVAQGSAKITSRENIDFGTNVSIVIKTKAGVPADADFAQPVDGMMALDTTNNRLYVRSGAIWKFVGVA